MEKRTLFIFRRNFSLILAAALTAAGCQSAPDHLREADLTASEIIAQKQEEAFGRREPFTIERPAETLRRRLLREQHLPRAPMTAGDNDPARGARDVSRRGEGSGPLRLDLLQTLQVGARNSREYQARKERVFLAALDLDLEREEFRTSFAGLLEGLVGSSGESGSAVSTATVSGEGSLVRRLKSGAKLTGLIALDLVKLLTQDRSSSLGIYADATISIPLLRGAGKDVVTEPLTQAEREALYAVWEFERFKKSFAVQTARDYLAVLLAGREVANAEENYRGLIASTRRARRLAEAGRLPWFQFDQSLQNELRARDRWVRAREANSRSLDRLKVAIGLPADAQVELDGGELEDLAATILEPLSTGHQPAGSGSVPPADAPVELAEPVQVLEGAGRMALEEGTALRLALGNRLDLRVALGRVYDARRRVAVKADALRSGLTLSASAAVGERRREGTAELPDAEVVLDKGRYAALLGLDLPLERTAERNAYRASFIDLEEAIRTVEGLEDQVKLEVRSSLRSLLESREGIIIQRQAVTIAERRVRSTDLLLQAGRAEIRDVLESSEALLNAQNSLAGAMVDYRVAEMELQRDLGLLQVDERGLWKEYDPRKERDGNS
jgi:outer membrane protein TolC